MAPSSFEPPIGFPGAGPQKPAQQQAAAPAPALPPVEPTSKAASPGGNPSGSKSANTSGSGQPSGSPAPQGGPSKSARPSKNADGTPSPTPNPETVKPVDVEMMGCDSDKAGSLLDHLGGQIERGLQVQESLDVLNDFRAHCSDEKMADRADVLAVSAQAQTLPPDEAMRMMDRWLAHHPNHEASTARSSLTSSV